MTLYKFIKWIKTIRLGKFNVKLSIDGKEIHKKITNKK